jgi:transcriptional regulator with XRE-family HTH domain
MITPKQINERFHAMLEEKMKDYGRGFNKFLHIETGISTGYLSEILAGTKPGSPETQMKICEALEIEYQSLVANTHVGSAKEASSVTFLEQHRCLLKEFENQELALEINQMLLRIEQVSPDKLETAKGVLEAVFKQELAPVKKRTASNKKA